MLTQLFIGCVQRLLGSVISIQSQFVEQIHAVRALKIPTMAIDLAELERTSEHRHERGGVIEKPLRGIASGEHTELTHPIVAIGAVDHIEQVADPPSARKVDASPIPPLFTRGLDGAEQCVATARPSKLM